MASPNFSDEKVEQYKIILKRPYWELHEAAHFLCGISEFALMHYLEDEAAQFLNMKCFGLIPTSAFREEERVEKFSEKELNEALEKLYTPIQREEVWAHSFKFGKGISYSSEKHPYLRKHTYFLHPSDAIAIAITEGIQLPFELQVASNLYQTKKPTKAKKGGWKNETRREALAQVYWYLNPEGSIQGFVRYAFHLKMESRRIESENRGKFEFVNGIGWDSPKNRGRIVKNIKCSEDLIQPIPGIMIKKEGYVAFDFMNLKVVLETIADYLCFENVYLTSEELLNHPLIQMYSEQGGLSLNKIVEFSLKKTLESLYLDESPPEF